MFDFVVAEMKQHDANDANDFRRIRPVRTALENQCDNLFAFAGVQEILGATVTIAKRNELHTFAVILQRWVVERSFAWLEKCRRLWKNCERQLNTSLQMVNLAFLVLLLKRC